MTLMNPQPKHGASTSVSLVFSIPDHMYWDWRVGIGIDDWCVALDDAETMSGAPDDVLRELLDDLEAGRTAVHRFDNESISTLRLRIVPRGDGFAWLTVDDWACGDSDGLYLDAIVPLPPLIADLRQACAIAETMWDQLAVSQGGASGWAP